MQHVAILKKEWKLVDKILSGKKIIESRWYKHRRDPWGNIKAGEVVYFKEGKVKAKAIVSKVLFFDNLDYVKIKEILRKYHKQLGVSLDYADKVRDKNYCILVFLADISKVEEFDIDKSGFGLMNAWLCVEDVESIMIK